MSELKLYESQEREYTLDSSEVFTVVELVRQYCVEETKKFSSDFGFTRWVGHGRSIEINAERRGRDTLGQYANLAQLFFAEYGTLTMRIRANTGLLADPSELVKVCEGCSLEPGT